MRCVFPALLLLTLMLGSCSNQNEPKPTMERVNAVRVAPQAAETKPAVPQGWCDAEFPLGAANAPLLKFPAMETIGNPPQAPNPPADRFVWVNLWATWCKPCVAELPILARWTQALANERVPFELWPISIDEERPVVLAYAKDKPALSQSRSYRLTKPEDLKVFLTPFGLAEGASVPIQILLAPGGKVRCVRAGSISDADYPILRALMQK